MTGTADGVAPLPGQPAGGSLSAGTRLTFPAYDIGVAHILRGGKCVGFVLAEFYCWRAYLFPVAWDSRIGAVPGCEEVTARTLGELRRCLRDRVTAEGPWWA